MNEPNNRESESYTPKPLPVIKDTPLARLKEVKETLENDPIIGQYRPQMVVDKAWHETLVALFIVFIIVAIVFFGYSVYLGKFQSSINQSVTLAPQVNPQINNEYHFNPTTSNQFNNTLVVNVNVTVINTNVS